MLSETWKEIYKCYEVSSEGRVRRKTFATGTFIGKIHRQYINMHGYPRLTLSINGKIKNKMVHQLVAEAFLGVIPRGMEINHIDGNKQNSRASNLEYATRSENQSHAIRTGLYKPARGHVMSKLTARQVKTIRRQYEANKFNQYQLAERYNVDQSTISNIIARRNWGWL